MLSGLGMEGEDGRYIFLPHSIPPSISEARRIRGEGGRRGMGLSLFSFSFSFSLIYFCLQYSSLARRVGEEREGEEGRRGGGEKDGLNGSEGEERKSGRGGKDGGGLCQAG